MVTKKVVDAKKADLIDKVLSMTPEQFDLLLYLLERHEDIDALDEPARTAKMQELKAEFLKNRRDSDITSPPTMERLETKEEERAKRGANA